jgi:cytochrome c biogenesis protein CcmG, thiol:disulfide interchange protein DsbE
VSAQPDRVLTRRSLLALAGGAVVLAACGGDDGGTATAASSSDSGGATTGGATTAATETTVAGAKRAKGEYQPVTINGTALVEMPDGGVDAAVGKAAPALSGYSFDGSPISITPGSDGKKLMVIFLAHWCPHCRKEVPLLVEWLKTGRAPTDTRVVAVATSSTNARPNFPPSNWLKDEKWPVDVMADSETYDAAAAYGLTGFPYFVLINKDGTVARRLSGEIAPGELKVYLDQGVN